jgi:RNA polymerase sigma factor (sigma-70 family)
MPSDAALLGAWQQGDRAAGEELFERYYGVLARFFANKVGEDPRDLIHDSLLGCISGHARLRDHQSFRAFLFSIAYNQLRKHYERQRRHGQRFDPTTQSSADLAPGPSTILGRGAEERLLLDSLRCIPVEHQVVLELFYWEGLKSTEIADILGEPHGTVRSRLRRARQLLAQAMETSAADPKVYAETTSDLDGWVAKIRAAITPHPLGGP